ncbi:MAG: double zinc ribbon domain-containing protein, partial [Planctomycetota bacterium]
MDAIPTLSRPEIDRPKAVGRSFGRRSLGLIFPPTCTICDACVAVGDDFCEPCRRRLHQSDEFMSNPCRRCGRPGAASVNTDKTRDGCGECKSETFRFDQVIALWTYEGLVQEAIVASKYGTRAALADALGRRLAVKVLEQARHGMPETLTSIPSHR